MRELRPVTSFLLSLVLFLGAEALLIYFGIVRVLFVFFIPVFYSSSVLSILPFLLFLLPILLLFRSSGKYTPFAKANREGLEYKVPVSGEKKKESGYGGIIMIGPIPILFGKGLSSKILVALVVLMIVLIVLVFIFAK